MKKKRVLVAGIAFVVAFLTALLYSTVRLTRSRHRVEVCMQFGGQRDCRVASAASRESALRAAVQNACALISGGVTDSQQCERSTPVSVKWLD